MKTIIITCALLISTFSLQASEITTKFNLSGFKVKIVQAKKFSYSCESTDLQNDNGVLTMKAKSDNETLTIYTPKVDEIQLNNCELNMEYKKKGETLSLIMDTGSKANIDIDIKQLNANIKDTSALVVSGYAKDMSYNLDNESKVESIKLKAENINIDASNSSMAILTTTAHIIDVNLGDKSGAILKGHARELKGVLEESARIKTDRLLIPDAGITVKTKWQ